MVELIGPSIVSDFENVLLMAIVDGKKLLLWSHYEKSSNTGWAWHYIFAEQTKPDEPKKLIKVIESSGGNFAGLLTDAIAQGYIVAPESFRCTQIMGDVQVSVILTKDGDPVALLDERRLVKVNGYWTVKPIPDMRPTL